MTYCKEIEINENKVKKTTFKVEFNIEERDRNIIVDLLKAGGPRLSYDSWIIELAEIIKEG